MLTRDTWQHTMNNEVATQLKSPMGKRRSAFTTVLIRHRRLNIGNGSTGVKLTVTDKQTDHQCYVVRTHARVWLHGADPSASYQITTKPIERLRDRFIAEQAYTFLTILTRQNTETNILFAG
jgi:hypothetical protein